MKNNYILIGVVALVLIGGIGYLLLSAKKTVLPQDSKVTAPTVSAKQSEDVMELKGTSGETIGSPSADNTAVKEFTIDGSNYSFSLKEMRVKRGDTVKIVFNNKDGFHDFTLDEFNVKTKQISAGANETVTFVAEKVGSFEYYCSVGQHRKNGMKGNFIVE